MFWRSRATKERCTTMCAASSMTPLMRAGDTDKGHGRIETRRDTVSHSVDGLLSDRR